MKSINQIETMKTNTLIIQNVIVLTKTKL